LTEDVQAQVQAVADMEAEVAEEEESEEEEEDPEEIEGVSGVESGPGTREDAVGRRRFSPCSVA